MQNTSQKLMLIFLLIIFSAITAFAAQGYLFEYDGNGNRTAVSYFNSCRLKDTTQQLVDTVSTKAIKEIQTVSVPSVYPNPSRDFFILSFPQEVSNIGFTITDMKGFVIDDQKGIFTKNTIYNVSGLANGAYIVYVTYTISDKQEHFTHKLIKE